MEQETWEKVQIKRENNLLKVVFLVGIVCIIFSLIRRDILWFLTSLMYIELTYGVYKIKVKEIERYKFFDLKKKLFLLSSIPLLLGASGFAGVIDHYLIFRNIFFVTVLSVLGFMLILNMDKYTSFRTNCDFTIGFIILFSIAGGTLLEISRFVSDEFLGTEILEDNFHFMLDITWITLFSFCLGLYFMFLIRNIKYVGSERIKKNFDFTLISKNHIEGYVKILDAACREKRYYLFIFTRLWQVGIFMTVVWGILTVDFYTIGWGIFSLALAMLPDIFNKKIEQEVPPLFYFWITTVLFIFAMGRPLGFYGMFHLWAEVTHLLAGTAVAILIFFLLIYLNWISDTLYFPPWLLFILVIFFMILAGVIWEIGEFIIDLIFETNLQPHLRDTVYDLLFNVFGGVIALRFAYYYFPKKLWTTSKKKK